MFALAIFLTMLKFCACLFPYETTNIMVTSNYGQELQVRVFGLHLGGCEKVLSQGDTVRCYSWWGTPDYFFCAYIPITTEPITSTVTSLRTHQSVLNNDGDATEEVTDAPDTTETEPHAIFGRNCPTKKGMRVLCSDLQSLGNCYGSAYACEVTSEGLCACNEVAN